MRRRAVLLALAFLPVAHPAAAQVRRWTVDASRSSITLRIRAVGLNQTGRFEDWTGDIRFDPAALETAQATIDVRAASLRMKEPVLTSRATGPDFLDAARWPTIRLRLSRLEQSARGGFKAWADVTVKGRTREVVFPADLRVTGDAAQMSGGFVLDRAAFDIGMQGPWNALMGRQVRVDVALAARVA